MLDTKKICNKRRTKKIKKLYVVNFEVKNYHFYMPCKEDLRQVVIDEVVFSRQFIARRVTICYDWGGHLSK